MLHFHVIRCIQYMAPIGCFLHTKVCNRHSIAAAAAAPTPRHRKWSSSPIYFPTIRIQLPMKNSPSSAISMSARAGSQSTECSRRKTDDFCRTRAAHHRVWFDFMHNMLMEINCQHNSISKSTSIVYNRSIHRSALMEALGERASDR